MIQQLMTDEKDRSLAEKAAPSAANYGLMVGNVNSLGMKAANPEKIAKLFQHCKKPGGASGFASISCPEWMKQDLTFKATGKKVTTVLLWATQKRIIACEIF